MSQRILVCDDEAYITRSIQMKLSRAGYDVQTASDGKEALDFIQQDAPALLITDCQMPRIDGLELCRLLRDDSATADLPVILLTAKSYELDHDQLRSELKVLHIVMKPFSPRELLKLVQDTVGAAVDVPATGAVP